MRYKGLNTTQITSIGCVLSPTDAHEFLGQDQATVRVQDPHPPSGAVAALPPDSDVEVEIKDDVVRDLLGLIASRSLSAYRVGYLLAGQRSYIGACRREK